MLTALVASSARATKAPPIPLARAPGGAKLKSAKPHSSLLVIANTPAGAPSTTSITTNNSRLIKRFFFNFFIILLLNKNTSSNNVGILIYTIFLSIYAIFFYYGAIRTDRP
ncbi:hypothetical protein MBAV_004802 [Candidatus Magnetobacterium bavaricum]|uniref:Uncharacterized protein n=1 Tax=Candidatus Magnetobacterium bavaricum TaxID=29290 RepID=A0A0F3GMG4_9BACT|nr:hypothetical protein MBAV_004802 [Candidatus Magnetobacterium bavaricum]